VGLRDLGLRLARWARRKWEDRLKVDPDAPYGVGPYPLTTEEWTEICRKEEEEARRKARDPYWDGDGR
jgi:hypothetical protein